MESRIKANTPLPSDSSDLPLDAVRLDEMIHSESKFRRELPWLWGATLFGPFILSAMILIGITIATGWEFTSRLIVAISLALWLLGRFIILSGADGLLQDIDGPLTSFQLFALVTYLDVTTALVLAFHIGYIFRLPFIGPRIATLVHDGEFILASHPWMRRSTYVGVIAFVSFPLAATGSVGGSIFGRLLGMTRLSTFVCILIGSVIGNGIMYWFSDVLGNWIDKDHPTVKYGGIALILIIVLILERRYQHLRKSFLESERQLAESVKHVNDGNSGV